MLYLPGVNVLLIGDAEVPEDQVSIWPLNAQQLHREAFMLLALSNPHGKIEEALRHRLAMDVELPEKATSTSALGDEWST